MDKIPRSRLFFYDGNPIVPLGVDSLEDTPVVTAVFQREYDNTIRHMEPGILYAALQRKLVEHYQEGDRVIIMPQRIYHLEEAKAKAWVPQQTTGRRI
ncbi:hypothetical protein HYZ97_02325 [Candidatus Pacearchaeota archaeon]|nr:hypothetical protein [Candidatus Pacearchaeota archaeon]